MPSPNPISKSESAEIPDSAGARRQFIGVALWFLATLVVLECTVRILGERVVGRMDPYVEYLRRAAWLRTKPRPMLLITGDSSAHEGLAPSAMGGVNALNIAVSGGSGIVAYHLAEGAPWHPDHILYAGIPIEVLDNGLGHATPLGMHERELLPLFDPSVWGILNADVVLARISALYGRHSQIRGWVTAAISAHGRPPRIQSDSLDPSLDEPDGFGSLKQPPATAESRNKEANTFAQYLAGYPPRVDVRAEFIVRALAAWSSPTTRRTVVIMPVSSEWRAAYKDLFPRSAMHAAWSAVAKRANATLLDCYSAQPDDSFRSADHMNLAGALDFSARLGAWVKTGAVPSGCVAGL